MTPRSATDVMHDILYAAVIDAIAALKSGAGNLPNTMLRDLNAIHANTTFADLPEGVRKAIEASVRSAFTRLLKEGYSVSSGTAPQPPRAAGPPRGPQGRPPPRHAGEHSKRDPSGRPPRTPGGGGPRAGGGQRPGGTSRPGGGRPGGGKPGGGKPR